MRKEEVALFLDKKIQIFLRDGFHYKGNITRLMETSFLFTDKFDKQLAFSYENVIQIAEASDE